MKVLVTGGRDYHDRDKVFSTLMSIDPPITMLLQGGAKGADSLAAEWGYGNVNVATIYPAWERDGKAGGAIRNSVMVDLNPDLVVAFPGGVGTADCVRKARLAGIPVLEVKRDIEPDLDFGTE